LQNRDPGLLDGNKATSKEKPMKTAPRDKLGKTKGPTVTDKLERRDLRPIRSEQSGTLIREIQESDQRCTLATLKIVELIVSGKVPQKPGEDYYLTACRLVVEGLESFKLSPKTKRALTKACSELQSQRRRAARRVDIVEMRSWRGKRAPIRAILLLTALAEAIGPAELAKWLEMPNPNLRGRAPADLMRTDRWLVLADFVDDMLAGSPT